MPSGLRESRSLTIALCTLHSLVSELCTLHSARAQGEAQAIKMFEVLLDNAASEGDTSLL